MTTTKANLAGQVFGKLKVISETRIEDRLGNKTKVTWLCRCECGEETKATTYQLRGGKRTDCGCEKLSNVKDLTSMRCGKLTVIKDTGKRTKYRQTIWLCKCECGEYVEYRADLLASNKAYSCGCSRRSTIDLIGDKFADLTVISEEHRSKRTSDKNRKTWLCRCECGELTSASTRDLQSGRKLSCGCRTDSKGEAVIKEYLESRSINYISEYKFKDLYFKSTSYPLRFDFAILNSKGKVEMLIEYDGMQHYKPSSYFGGQEEFERVKLRDRAKDDYCKEHDIPLLRIPYTEYENINEILYRSITNY